MLTCAAIFDNNITKRDMKISRIIKSIIPHHISTQVGLVFVVLIIISLGFLGFSLINSSRYAVVNSVLRDYEDIAHRAAQELTNFIDKPGELLVNTAAVFANLPPADRDTQKMIIYQLFANHAPQFEHIAVTDIAGQETLTSNWSKPLKDISSTEIFQLVSRTKQPSFSRVYFSRDVPYFSVAAPIKKLEQTTGFLVAEVKLLSLWETINNIRLSNGEAFIVNEKGYILVHRQARRVYLGENLAFAKPVQESLQGQEGSMEDASISDNKSDKYLVAYAPIKPFGWGLIIRQPLSTAYAFSYQMQKTAVIAITLAILIAILFASILARWIVKPIRQLVQATHNVASGNLDAEIVTTRQDEVGGLLRSFNEMIKKLRRARQVEKLSTIGLATSKIGHELRNPLVALKTFVQLLPHRRQEQNFINQFNELVPTEMDRLEKMLQELTDFSAIPKLRLDECAPNSFINHSLDLFRERFSQRNIVVHSAVEVNHTMVMVDTDRFNQVLINLINNAIAAMPNGGELHINGSVDETEKLFVLEIKDTGCGIPPEQLSQLFEPFMTSKRGGLGLGLTICKEIVEQHRGRIDVKSEPDKGTNFIIKIPISRITL
ncbi:MAG: sensor histidine kinase [Planctomycetes bacterium]|nr:sensor histidine kinase [Planctomycetota bacterium]